MAEELFWSHSLWSLELFILMDLYIYGFCVCVYLDSIDMWKIAMKHCVSSFQMYGEKSGKDEKEWESLKHNCAFLGHLQFCPEKRIPKFLKMYVLFFTLVDFS